jgi:hypothetical protein
MSSATLTPPPASPLVAEAKSEDKNHDQEVKGPSILK